MDWKERQALRAPKAVGVVFAHSGPSRKELRRHIRQEVKEGVPDLPESPMQRMLRESINRAVAIGLGKMERI